MNGLDKIIAQILDDAKQESLAIQEKAAGEAETTLAAAGEKVKKLEEEQAKSAAQREKAMRNGFVLRRAKEAPGDPCGKAGDHRGNACGGTQGAAGKPDEAYLHGWSSFFPGS